MADITTVLSKFLANFTLTGGLEISGSIGTYVSNNVVLGITVDSWNDYAIGFADSNDATYTGALNFDGNTGRLRYRNTGGVVINMTLGSVNLPSFARGTGALGGCSLGAGRNTSGNGAAGTINLVSAAGTSYYLWVDATGDLRVHTAAPTEDGTTVSDTAGTVVGAQT